MAEITRGPQVSYDLWLSDKKEPKEKTFQTGTTAVEFFASRSTVEYQTWRALPKENKPEAPANKYVYVTLTVFDKKAQEHLYKIYYKVSEARSKGGKDVRPNLHVTGELRNQREYEGKNYEDVTVRDASPLIWTPLVEG
jgi:oligoribonuclease NrnB/cAMP/cGMP phosphodiesterase (DHH superfamily)